MSRDISGNSIAGIQKSVFFFFWLFILWQYPGYDLDRHQECFAIEYLKFCILT